MIARALESAGEAIVARFGPLNVWTAVLLAGAVLVDRAVAHRARASLRIALYAPVALRVLAPLAWSLPLGAPPTVDAYIAPLAEISAHPAEYASAAPAVWWYSVGAVIYVAGALVLFARAAIARVLLARALADARRIELDVGAPCPVFQHAELGPLVVGVLHPRIVVPSRLLTPGEEQALACVLRHEGAHVRRGDAWLSGAMQLLSIVAWPVLPVWVAVARVRALIELACDEAALAGADAAERRRYGHTLLDMAESHTFAAPPLAAAQLHFGSTLRARIEALTAQRHWPLLGQALVAVAAPVGLVLVCGGAAAPKGPDDDGYGYQFDADSPAIAAVTPAKPSPPDGPGGKVPPEAIQAAVRAHYGAFEACYKDGLAKDAKLTGTVVVRFTAGEDGITKDAVDEGSTLPDKAVVACVIAEFKRATYPKAQAGLLTVVYAIAFAP